jgi:hypothetical protein
MVSLVINKMQSSLLIDRPYYDDKQQRTTRRKKMKRQNVRPFRQEGRPNRNGLSINYFGMTLTLSRACATIYYRNLPKVW